MKHSALAKKNKESVPESWDDLKEKLVSKKIREKYSLNQELAILRQRDVKSEEFAEYYAYVETCKKEVKSDMSEVD